MLDGMQVVDDGAVTQIEEVLAAAAVASARSLPAADVGEGMFQPDPLPQLGSALRGELPLA